MFKLLRLVGVFLMMTSGVSYAMEPEPTDFKKSILKQAIDFCDRHIAFEMDTIDFYQEDKRLKSEQSIGSERSSFSYDQIARSSDNISVFTQFKLELEDETRFNSETFLSKLLDARFFFLASRHDIIREVRSLVRESMDNFKQGKKVGGGATYGPTRPDYFEQLPPYEQTLARNSTDRYQMVNGLILLMWKLVDPRMLKAQTKLKVRVSTTLWDNLTGKREYLGHPDEAIIVYNDGSDLPNVTLYGTDMVLYDNHIKKQKITIDPLGWAKGQRMSMTSTPYEVSLWDQRQSFYKKIPEAPYPDWLKPYPKLQTTSAKEPPLETLQKTEKLTETYLKKKKKSAHKKRAHKVKPSFSEAKPSMGSEEEKLNNQISPVEIISPMTEPEEKKIESLSIVETVRPIIVEEESDEREKESPMEVEEVSHNDSGSFDNDSNSYDYVRPAGMRRFHEHALQKMEIQAAPKVILKGAHLSTRDAIFDSRQFKNVSFGQFKSLWKHVAGEKSVVESTGSSHKKLIGPNGKVFGTFSHGDNMTYGPRTIKYIRDALIQIGYGPVFER